MCVEFYGNCICSITSQMGCVLRSNTIQPLASKSEENLLGSDRAGKRPKLD
jgi:hypothetical protein